jgi:hypothetical protein
MQHGLEKRIALTLHQQFQRLDNRQARVDEGHELLVEDDKLVLLDLAATRQPRFG